jgi:cytochrome c oxidase subunit 2
MWDDFPLFPESASSLSGRVDALAVFLVGMSSFFAALICALIVVFAIKYRRKAGRTRGVAIEGSLPLELVWTVVPFGLTMILFVWGAKLFFAGATPPQDVTDLTVVGKQWMWKIQHPQGQREINELHVPLGRAIRLTMTSEDVIHSFFVPVFRVKQDVLPGRYSRMWFRPTKAGTFHLFCAEYCGTKHSEMIGSVVVMEPQDYERWLSGSVSDEPPAEAGRKLFESLRCDTCHLSAPGAETKAGPTGVPAARGPSLRDLFGHEVELEGGGKALADEAYLRESILKPMAKVTKGFQPLMPTYAGQVGEEQILQLIAYIKTLKAEGGGR